MAAVVGLLLEGLRREIALQFAAAYSVLAVVLGLLSLQRPQPPQA